MNKNLITVTLLAVLPNLAFTQTKTTQLDEVKVYSAYATPINQDKTASSLTVLTEKDFAARNATYLSDVLKTVAGVTLTASGGRGTLTNVLLRGADANHASVIIDGVKVNPVTGYGFDFGGLSLSNIERIEVLRGEQSALWGSDAMGGVIYITTKSGLYKDKPFNIDFDLGTGSQGTYDASATISGYQNGFYYALHGDSHRTRGISAYSANTFHYTAENGTKIKTGGATERDKFHRDNASLRFGYDDGKKGVELLGSHSSQNAHFDNSLAGEKSFDDYTRTRETLFKLSSYLGTAQELIKQKFSISHLKTDSDTFSSYISAYDAKKFNSSYQLDINFDREGDITQAVSVLADYQKSYYDSSSYSEEKGLKEKSVATEYRLFSEDDHSLSLSGRYIDSSQYENAFTGRIAGAYRLSPNFRLHASFGTAIQNPTMTEYYGWNGKYVANPNLKAEKSKGGDAGVLIESSDKHHSFDLTYFARNVSNFISSRTVSCVVNVCVSQATNLDGTTKIKGMEAAYNGKITDNLSSFANYTFTRVKDNQGVEVIRRPKHTANFGLAYQISEKLGSNVSLSYVGKRVDTYFDEVTYAASRVKLPAYTVVNVGVNYQLSQNLNIYANLNNLFNKKYEQTLGYGQPERNVYVGLKGSF